MELSPQQAELLIQAIDRFPSTDLQVATLKGGLLIELSRHLATISQVPTGTPPAPEEE